jgi:uncharacterized membrane protein
MRRPDFGRWIYAGSFVAVVAALTHFVVLLALPAVAEHDAFARVEALAPPFRTVAVPAAASALRAFPYLDPAAAAAICRYDLAGGPVRVKAPLGDAPFASLSFHSRRGVTFYTLTDRAASKGRIEALLVTAEQLRALVARDDEDNPSEDLRIVSPTAQGFALARALSASPDRLGDAAAQAQAMACAPEPIAEAEK